MLSKEIDFPLILLAGAQKSGTSLLYNILTSFDFVTEPVRKEPTYFTLPEDTVKNNTDKYRQLVQANQRNPGDNNYCIDASTAYFVSRRAANYFSQLPNAKLIFILRDPLQRAYSGFLHQHKKVPTTDERSFNQILNKIEGSNYEEVSASEDKLLNRAVEKGLIDTGYYSEDYLRKVFNNDLDYEPEDRRWAFRYLSMSHYSHQLKKFYEIDVPVHVVFFEKFLNNFTAELTDILDFLNAPPEAHERVDSLELPHSNPTVVPRGPLARSLLRIKNSPVIGTLLKIIYGSQPIRSILYGSPPPLNPSVLSEGEKILNTEYNYWLEKAPELNETWKI